MAVTEGVDDVRRAPRAADRRQRVGQARAVAHPGRDALFRIALLERRKHPVHVPQEHPGALPVRRRLEAGELDRAGDADAELHRGCDELAVGVGDRQARHRLGIADHEVVAALGLERQVVAELRRERLRPDAGRDHRAVRRNDAAVGADALEAPAVELESGCTRTLDPAAVAQKALGEAVDEPVRVRRVPVLGDEHALDVVAGEGRLELAQLVGVELVPGDAVVAPELPGEALLPQALLRAIDEEVAGLLDEVLGAGVLEERRKRRERRAEDGAQGLRLLAHLLRAAGGDEADEPRRERRQIAPADDERPHRIGQPARHVADRARHRHRHDRGAVEAAGIAEGGALAGIAGLDQDDVVALALQEARRRDADHAGADHADRLLHRPLRSSRPERSGEPGSKPHPPGAVDPGSRFARPG